MEVAAVPAVDVAERAPSAVVAAQDITRRYGEGDAAVDALRGVTLDVGQGKLTAVMGPSGSGKSTLMHIMAALDRPTSGTVWIAGTKLGSLSDKEITLLRRKHIGFVFQFFNLLPMLTAEENVTLPLAIAGEKPDPAWVEELLDTFGIADRRTHRPAGRVDRLDQVTGVLEQVAEPLLGLLPGLLFRPLPGQVADDAQKPAGGPARVAHRAAVQERATPQCGQAVARLPAVQARPERAVEPLGTVLDPQ